MQTSTVTVGRHLSLFIPFLLNHSFHAYSSLLEVCPCAVYFLKFLCSVKYKWFPYLINNKYLFMLKICSEVQWFPADASLEFALLFAQCLWNESSGLSTIPATVTLQAILLLSVLGTQTGSRNDTGSRTGRLTWSTGYMYLQQLHISMFSQQYRLWHLG